MSFRFAAGLVWLSLLASAPAQNPPVGGDLLRNGSFEATYEKANVWNGVDKDGFLAGFQGYMPVLAESGSIADAALPPAVAAADLNGDGLTDLMTSDPLGYVRSYVNSGSKEEPKFTSGLVTTPYLGRADGTPIILPGTTREEAAEEKLRVRRSELWSKRRLGVKISLADLGDGRRALVAGNYFGDLFFIPQSAAAGMAAFPQPETPDRAFVSMSKTGDVRWGNLFAPVMHDWDKDGKADLLVGEGSYSANNIHFFPNDASTAAPVFNPANQSVLALGQGRQQLTPAVADINGDSRDDLLVADNRGKITAYLRPDGWKRGDSIKPSGFLSRDGGVTENEGQAISLGEGIHTVGAADLNGDSLIDLVAGKPSGRIAWAPNKGSKEQPKFEGFSDIAGEKANPAIWLPPSQWEMDSGESRGNAFAFATAVSAQEDPAVDAKQGSRALKFGFAPSGGSPLTTMNFPGDRSFRFAEYEQESHFYDLTPSERMVGAPNRLFIIQQRDLTLQVGKPYTLSFQHKGSGVLRANVFLGWWGFKVLGGETVTRGARGAAQVQYNHANEHGNVSKDFKPANSWTALNEQFSVKFKDKNLQAEPTTHKAVFIIVFELAAPDGVLYLDDVKVVPAAG